MRCATWSIGIGATLGVGHRCTQVSSSRVDLTTSQIKSEAITKRGVTEYWIYGGRPRSLWTNPGSLSAHIRGWSSSRKPTS